MQDQDNTPLDISQIPPAISGSEGHSHTLRVANGLAAQTDDFEVFRTAMEEWNKTCLPPWSPGELAHKMEAGWSFAHGVTPFLEFADPLPRARVRKVNFKHLNELAFASRGRYAELLETLQGMAPTPPLEEIIDQMYPGNPLICRAAGSWKHAMTAPRESIRGVEKEMEWIVPSPMSALQGYAPTTDNPNSRRCRENAGPRRYIVVEFDFTLIFRPHIEAWEAKGISTRDVQAQLVLWLASEGEYRQWPFLIVDSGGKSLHNWYSISDRFDEEDALGLLSRAIPLGADKKADQPEQFFRFPGGTRKSEKSQPQPILFYDPKKL